MLRNNTLFKPLVINSQQFLINNSPETQRYGSLRLMLSLSDIEL